MQYARGTRSSTRLDHEDTSTAEAMNQHKPTQSHFSDSDWTLSLSRGSKEEAMVVDIDKEIPGDPFLVHQRRG